MKLIYLTNIPAPYRIKRFNAMVPIFKDEGIEFEVWFMSDNEVEREWKIDYNSIEFKYKIWDGFHPSIGKYRAHFNPGILKALKKENYNIVIVAGMSCPTTWFSKLFIRKSATRIMSIETNLLGDTSKKGIKKFVKHKLLQNYDAYQVTGHLQIEYINYFNPESKNSHYIVLPNLIDDSIFSSNGEIIDLSQYNYSGRKYLCVLPHRILKYKIPMEFIEATAQSKETHFLIVGTGDKKYEEIINKKIVEEKLPITIIAFTQQKDMAKIYRSVDYFCLPSKTDASPLTPIEAIASGLPIIVSDRIGNMSDVLKPAENGFSFDPYSQEDIIKSIHLIEGLSKKELKEMGEKSQEIYQEIFDNDICLRRYAKGIKEIIKLKNNK